MAAIRPRIVLLLALASTAATGTLVASSSSAQETALPAQRAAARAAPRDAAAQRSLGQALLRAGRYREARDAFGRAARLSRNSLESLFDVARVAFAEGDHRAAERACAGLARVEKAAVLTRVCEARTDLVWNRSGRAFETLDAALATEPNNYEGLYALGEAHRRRSAVAEAETAYRRASSSRSSEAAPYLGLGRLYVAAGRLDDARRELRRARELDTTDPEIAYELGRLLEGTEAQTLLDEASRGRPSWPEAQTALGDVAYRARTFEAAEAAYRAALRTREAHEPAHVGLGLTLLELGRLDEAEASLSRALELVSNDAVAVTALADLQARAGHYEEAYEGYRHAADFDPRNIEPLLRGAELALARQRDVLASGFLDRALGIEESNGRALALYGDVMRARRDARAARDYYERALRARGPIDRARVEEALRSLPPAR